VTFENDHAPPAAPPHRVRLPVNIHHWDDISFLHWAVEPCEITRLLPTGLTPVTWDGSAWVSVTPFFIRVRPPGIPFVPPGWAFPETNVRTYVAGPGGREGLWFLHMEVTALWFVATLRSIGLPYVQRRMSVNISDERRVYVSRPRRAASSGGGHRIVVRPGAWLRPTEGGPFERFLTARWGAYHRRGPLLLYTPVDHPPWSLRHGEVETCEVDALFRSAGLRVPTGPPVCHASPGTAVKIGPPRRAA
jgi:uncharacterized protein YqjF (DUF2071 family)